MHVDYARWLRRTPSKRCRAAGEREELEARLLEKAHEPERAAALESAGAPERGLARWNAKTLHTAMFNLDQRLKAVDEQQ